jgi:hypothetical protein
LTALLAIGTVLSLLAIFLLHVEGDTFGAIESDKLLGSDLPAALMAILSNAPQLLVSIMWLSLKKVITRAVQSREFSSYSRTRKPLRVSQPQGQQRSAYLLKLPISYAVLCTLMSALLHFLMSKSIFPVMLRVYSTDGSLTPRRLLSACGYSFSALASFLGAAAGVTSIILPCAYFRKPAPDTPAICCCSVALIAACHANPREQHALMPVQYGEEIGRSVGDSGQPHVTFTSNEVVPLRHGVTYL